MTARGSDMVGDCVCGMSRGGREGVSERFGKPTQVAAGLTVAGVWRSVGSELAVQKSL